MNTSQVLTGSLFICRNENEALGIYSSGMSTAQSLGADAWIAGQGSCQA
jgi:hypothetical protein